MSPAARVLDGLRAPHAADELLTRCWPERWLVVHGPLGRPAAAVPGARADGAFSGARAGRVFELPEPLLRAGL